MSVRQHGPSDSVKKPKLIPGTPEFAEAAKLLIETWSPEQIAKGAPGVGACRDTIYSAVRGMPPGPDRDLLISCLKRGGSVRRPVKPKAERRAERLGGFFTTI